MNGWQITASIVFPLVTVAASGAIAFITARHLGTVSASREQRVTYLLDAYRMLVDCANRSSLTRMQKDQLERSLSDTYPLGDSEQVTIAGEFMAALARDRSADLNHLLLSLRKSLRTELRLASDDATMQMLRISG